MKIMQVNICWYESFKICCRLLPQQWTQSSIFIVLSPFQGLLSLWNVPLIESTANPHLQFDISCSCPINPIDSLHWFNLASPSWTTVMGTCVYIYWMWIYCICGRAVGHVGLGVCGFGCAPRDGCTAETSRRRLQHLSTRSKLPSHYYKDLMGLSCPRSLRLYHLPWENNSASSPTLIEILYLLNLHYCWRVAEFSLGQVIHGGI